jgi:hypothetical protein
MKIKKILTIILTSLNVKSMESKNFYALTINLNKKYEEYKYLREIIENDFAFYNENNKGFLTYYQKDTMDKIKECLNNTIENQEKFLSMLYSLMLYIAANPMLEEINHMENKTKNPERILPIEDVHNSDKDNNNILRKINKLIYSAEEIIKNIIHCTRKFNNIGYKINNTCYCGKGKYCYCKLKKVNIEFNEPELNNMITEIKKLNNDYDFNINCKISSMIYFANEKNKKLSESFKVNDLQNN